jgi:hypothetical protein
MKKSSKELAAQNETLQDYKVNITPCSPFKGHDGKGNNIVIRTDDIDKSMREYQRNRLPFLWMIISIKDPK